MNTERKDDEENQLSTWAQMQRSSALLAFLICSTILLGVALVVMTLRMMLV